MASSLGGVARGRNNNFNLIRMMAALGVLISHAYPLALGRGAAEPLQASLGMSLGTVCVLVFFLLSGFFVAGSFDRTRSSADFLFARALRLFPGLAMSLAVTIVTASLLSGADPSQYWYNAVNYFLRNLTLVYGVNNLPGVFTENPYPSVINGSLWTLFFEVLCYALVLVLGGTKFLKRPKFILGLLVGWAALDYLSGKMELAERLELLTFLGLPFIAGITFWVWRDKIQFTATLCVLCLVLLILSSVLTIPKFLSWSAAAYLVMYIGFASSSVLLLYNKLGDYSYGIYIYAFPIQQIAAQFGATTPLQNVVVSAPITLGVAILSWHYIERPALMLKNRLRSKA